MKEPIPAIIVSLIATFIILAILYGMGEGVIRTTAVISYL